MIDIIAPILFISAVADVNGRMDRYEKDKQNKEAVCEITTRDKPKEEYNKCLKRLK